MGQETPSSEENILYEWVNTSTQAINVVVLEWGYGVSGSNPKGTSLISFQWEGVTTTISKKNVLVSGEFIIMDEFLLEDWSGHPFEIGQVSLIERESKGVDPALVIEVRISEKCCNEVWKGFVLGLCGRDKGGVTVGLKVKRLTPSDWKKIQEPERYKDRDCILAVQKFSVHSAGRLETLG